MIRVLLKVDILDFAKFYNTFRLSKGYTEICLKWGSKFVIYRSSCTSSHYFLIIQMNIFLPVEHSRNKIITYFENEAGPGGLQSSFH